MLVYFLEFVIFVFRPVLKETTGKLIKSLFVFRPLPKETNSKLIKIHRAKDRSLAVEDATDLNPDPMKDFSWEKCLNPTSVTEGRTDLPKEGPTFLNMIEKVRVNTYAKRSTVYAFVRKDHSIKYHSICFEGFEFAGKKAVC